MGPPATLSIVCPVCEPAQVIGFSPEDSEATCPSCHLRLRVVTRRLKEASSQGQGAAQARFVATTFEDGDRVRPRAFVASPTVRLAPGAWVTFAYARERLVGVADQTSSLWYPVEGQGSMSESGHRRFLGCMGAVILALAGVQAARAVGLASTVLSRPAGFVCLALALAFAASPAILWALQRAWGRQERYLPAGHSSDLA